MIFKYLIEKKVETPENYMFFILDLQHILNHWFKEMKYFAIDYILYKYNFILDCKIFYY